MFQLLLVLQLMCRSSLEHPHHTLFIILALVNANMDDSFSSGRLSKTASRQPSQLDMVYTHTHTHTPSTRTLNTQANIHTPALIASSEGAVYPGCVFLVLLYTTGKEVGTGSRTAQEVGTGSRTA